MNTRIWGPPTWRFLHGTSFLGNGHAKDIGKLVRSLGKVMPCIYCRNSYEGFARELDIDDIETTVASGKYSMWVYDLHNKVVAKLQRQILEKVEIPSTYYDSFIEESKLPYEVLRKRLMSCMPYFSEEDVLIMLGIFALSAIDDETNERKKQFLVFARAVCNILLAVQVCQPFATRLKAALRPISVLSFNNKIMAAILTVEIERRPTSDEVLEHCKVLSIAKAGSCSRGVCI